MSSLRPLPYGRQDISDGDIAAVTEVLRSDWLTQGPTVGRFESAVAAYCGATHAVAVNSATSALHLACLALDLGPGDCLWTSPNTFVASANCARYCGADVDFVDIDARTLNISVPALARKLERASREGRLPRVLIPVHFAGQSAPMREIFALAREHGVRVVEDASHAIGGRYLDQPVGCGKYSDISVFSLHPVKVITSGEGGLALTNDPALAAVMMRLRSHGITRDPVSMQRADSEGPWYYEQQVLGFNYRLTDIHAALGLSQLSRLDGFVAKRRALAAMYDEKLRDLPAKIPGRDPDAQSAWHLYVVRVASNIRRRVFEGLRSSAIGVNVHYFPVHLQPYYTRMGFQRGDFPEAEAYYDEAITLPLFPAMTEQDIDRVVVALKTQIERANQ